MTRVCIAGAGVIGSLLAGHLAQVAERALCEMKVVREPGERRHRVDRRVEDQLRPLGRA